MSDIFFSGVLVAYVLTGTYIWWLEYRRNAIRRTWLAPPVVILLWPNYLEYILSQPKE